MHNSTRYFAYNIMYLANVSNTTVKTVTERVKAHLSDSGLRCNIEGNDRAHPDIESPLPHKSPHSDRGSGHTGPALKFNISH